MKSGHRILCRDYIKAPIKVLIKDPCSFGQPRILAIAHKGLGGYRLDRRLQRVWFPSRQLRGQVPRQDDRRSGPEQPW